MGQDKEVPVRQLFGELTLSTMEIIRPDSSGLRMTGGRTALSSQPSAISVRWADRSRFLTGVRGRTRSAYGLFALSGLAEDPPEGDDANHGDYDDRNQAASPQATEWFSRGIGHRRRFHPVQQSDPHATS